MPEQTDIGQQQTDTLPLDEGHPQIADKATTPDEGATSYTKEEAEKLVQTALRERGREIANEQKQKYEGQLTELKGTVKSLQDQIDGRELAAIDPTDKKAVSLHEANITNRNLRTEISQAKTEAEYWKGLYEKANEQNQMTSLKGIAARYDGVDVEDLKGKTPEQALKFCNKYGKLKPEFANSERHEEPPKPGVIPIRGDQRGPSSKSEQDVLKEIYPTMFK